MSRAIRAMLLSLALVIGRASADAQCTARTPALSTLVSDFSADELAFFAQILPTPTSDDPLAVHAELRAPFHIPCLMKAFPHLQAFQDQRLADGILHLKLSAVAQPPHVLLFDAREQIVQGVPIAPAWTAFQVRDLIVEAISSSNRV